MIEDLLIAVVGALLVWCLGGIVVETFARILLSFPLFLAFSLTVAWIWYIIR